MHNEYQPATNDFPEYQVLENGTVVQRGDDGIYRPLVNSQSHIQQDSEPQYQPRGSVKKEKRNHPPNSKYTNFIMGSLVVGLCTLPIAAHVAVEYKTNETIDAVKPGGDEPLSPGDLFHDLGKTADALTLKPIRTMLGGE